MARPLVLIHDDWLAAARRYGEKGKAKMLVNPGAGAAGAIGDARALLDHFIGRDIGTEMEGWQQFVVRARDERGDGVSDYMIEVLTEKDTLGHHLQRCTSMSMRMVPIRAFDASRFGCQKAFWLGAFRSKCGFTPQPELNLWRIRVMEIPSNS